MTSRSKIVIGIVVAVLVIGGAALGVAVATRWRRLDEVGDDHEADHDDDRGDHDRPAHHRAADPDRPAHRPARPVGREPHPPRAAR